MAAEWQAAAIRADNPDDVRRFYAQARGIGADLAAWHETPERQEWTRMIVHVARESGAGRIVDIGCGAGHDLLALRAALPVAHLSGVEPNAALRRALPVDIRLHQDIDTAPITEADLLICIDVLEHVVDPERFLGGIAQRAPVGCLLMEATATHDAGTPLHLAANRGWQPGRVLERCGWQLVDEAGRLHVWRRVATQGRQTMSLLLCAYRSVAADTLSAVLGTVAGGANGWRLRVKTGDALISRSRGIVTTAWWRETGDDVFLMLDDDIGFAPDDADRLVEQCRAGHDVICAAYPVHNGAHLALRCLPGGHELAFGPGRPPVEIQYAATGFMAVHRRVLDALIAQLPLCHGDQPWSFYNLFPQLTVQAGEGHEVLSEDYGFCELARRGGFRIWLDPTIRLRHASTIPVSVANMAAVHAAIAAV